MRPVCLLVRTKNLRQSDGLHFISDSLDFEVRQQKQYSIEITQEKACLHHMKKPPFTGGFFHVVRSNLAAESDRLDDARIVNVEGERSGFVIKCVSAGGEPVLVCLGEGGFAVHLLDVLVALSDAETAEGADTLSHDIVARHGQRIGVARVFRSCDGAEDEGFGTVEGKGDEAHAVA